MCWKVGGQGPPWLLRGPLTPHQQACTWGPHPALHSEGGVGGDSLCNWLIVELGQAKEGPQLDPIKAEY